MKHQDFEIILNNRIESIRKTLNAKGTEYATEDDRLHNFKVAARIANTTPARALKGMFLKHLVSIFDLIDYDAQYGLGPNQETYGLIDEKVGDAINYLVLLEAILKDK